jgi:hypothetical protein
MGVPENVVHPKMVFFYRENEKPWDFGGYLILIFTIRWGPQDSVQLVYKWLNSMIYGRYNELVNGDYHGFC